MALNSSSNHSLPTPDILLESHCFFIPPNSLVFTSFSIIKILLLLPLCILIIYLGLQRRRQQRSTSAAATSHSDSFTYHMVAMELGDVLGCIINCCGVYREDTHFISVGYSLWYFTWYGEMFFHLLTCVERYLAVVHPVTYLSLRGEKGTRLRNISIGFVWLLCCVTTSAVTVNTSSIFLYFGFMIVSLTIISFCSLSVLCVLIRPGPGELGGARGRVDQLKRRAFHTMFAILGVLILRFCGNVSFLAVFVLNIHTACAMSTSQVWFNLPSSLVLPLLFLQKAGTLEFLKTCTK